MEITRWPQKLRRFAALGIADKWLLLRAAGWLAIARIQLATTPFDHLVARLSSSGQEGSTTSDPELLRRIGFAIAAAAANVPWRSDCFPQVLAARAILRRYNCSSTIHLGVERAGDDALLGHAWLTCGGEVVTGGTELDRYTEVHQFSG
jgi:hypothetical protein